MARALTLALAIVAALAGGAVASAQADGAPRPDSPNGASVELVNTTARPGGSVSFSGRGFVNDQGGGQIVTVKLNDADTLGTAEARADGTVSGSVTIPATLPPGEYWLRFLAGAGRPDDGPARTLHATFTLQADDPVVPTTTPVPTTTTTSTSTTTPSATATTTVPAAGSSGQERGDTLAASGFATGPVITGGVLLVLMGLLLLVGDRRRRARRADAAGRA